MSTQQAINRAKRIADDLAIVRGGQCLANHLFEVHAQELLGKLKEAMSKILDTPAENLSVGGWPCPTSPTKYCWYDLEADPSRDDCIFCRDPSERK